MRMLKKKDLKPLNNYTAREENVNYENYPIFNLINILDDKFISTVYSQKITFNCKLDMYHLYYPVYWAQRHVYA